MSQKMQFIFWRIPLPLYTPLFLGRGLETYLKSIFCKGSVLVRNTPKEITLSLNYSWPQEPNGYVRTAKVAIPDTQPGEKVPVVFHLHGNGGQGNTHPFGNFLGDACIIVAPDGYERSW